MKMLSGPIFILLFGLLIIRSWSEGSTHCEIADPAINWTTNSITPPSIRDIDHLNLVYNYTGNVAVSTPDDSDSGSPYIEATTDLDNHQIQIKTNEYFTNYLDEGIAATSQTFTLLLRTIIVTCGGIGFPLILTLNVTDTNNNPPIFPSVTYAYTIPMPLMPIVDLTSFGEPIIIDDQDFSLQTISFSVYPPDYFVLETERLPNKQYRAILKVAEYVRFDQEQRLIITANDGVNQGVSVININKNENVSVLEVPKLSHLFYEYRIYFYNSSTPIFTAVDPTKHIIVTASDPTLVTLTLSGGYSDLFAIYYDAASNVADIVMVGPLPTSSEDAIVFTLTASLGTQTTSAAIIVKLPCQII